MFCLHFSPTLLVYGHLVRRGEGRDGHLLMNLLLGVAKRAIYSSRQWAIEGAVHPDFLPLYRGYVRGQVSLEREHAVSTGTVDAFCARWAPQGLGCIIDPNNHLLV